MLAEIDKTRFNQELSRVRGWHPRGPRNRSWCGPAKVAGWVATKQHNRIVVIGAIGIALIGPIRARVIDLTFSIESRKPSWFT